MIVDSHVHVVATDQRRYPLQTTVSRTMPKSVSATWFREMPVTIEHLLEEMEEARVDRAVLVQPISAYTYDNSYAADGGVCYPGRVVSVGIIDMLDRGAADRLTYWIRDRGMSGLRITLGGEDPGSRLDDPYTYPVWERAASLAIPVCVLMHSQHISSLRPLLQRFPTVPVVVDHLASLPVEDEPPYESAGDLFDLAKFSNLYLKFSMMNLNVMGRGPATAREFLQRAMDRFGVHRLMWGSNFPASHDHSYKEMVDISRQALSLLRVEDQKWLLGETALSLWPALRG